MYVPKYDYVGKVEGFLGLEDIQVRLPRTGTVVWKKRDEVELINKEE